MISKAPLPLNKSFTIQPRKKVLEIAHKQPLSFQMKLEIANFDPRYRYMAEEVGYLLESLLSGVEKGLTEIPAYQKIINSVIVGKTRNKSIEEEIKEKKEEKRKIRHHLIKQTLKENGVLPENELKRKELMKKREEELIKAKAKEKEKEEEKKKKNEEWDKRIKKHGEVKKKLGENHKKKLEEEVKKNNDDEKKKENEKNEKKKQFIEFNKKTKEKLVNYLNFIIYIISF